MDSINLDFVLSNEDTCSLLTSDPHLKNPPLQKTQSSNMNPNFSFLQLYSSIQPDIKQIKRVKSLDYSDLSVYYSSFEANQALNKILRSGEFL